MHVTLLRPDPHQPSSFAIALEMLQTANRVARMHRQKPPFEISIVTPPDADPTTDLVLVPGLGLATEAEVRQCLNSPGFADLTHSLQLLAKGETRFAAACSAGFALGAAGLLDGRQVTISWWLAPLLLQLYPRCRLRLEHLLVSDGRLTTAGAAFSQIDLMLHLIETHAGSAIAEDCRRFLTADSRQSQLPYLSVATLVASDAALQQAELFLRRNIAAPLTVADLAAAAGLGQRSFARRLQRVTAMTPLQFIQSLRISEAIRLAANTPLSQEEIAHRVGYGDAGALRRIMRRQLGRSLSSFR